MDFKAAVRTCLGKYATFTGRAGRAEFWWFALFNLIARVIARMIDNILFGGPFVVVQRGMGHGYGYWEAYSPGGLLSGIVVLVLILPQLAVGARRLHDSGRSGWWQLLVLIPLIGWLVLVYWVVQPSAAPNRYGEGPEPPEA